MYYNCYYYVSYQKPFLTLEVISKNPRSSKNQNITNTGQTIWMVLHFNAKGMLYYKKIISVEQTKVMGILLSEMELKKSKINKAFIQLPDNDN